MSYTHEFSIFVIEKTITKRDCLISRKKSGQALAMTMNKKIQLQDLGNKDYKATWDYQEELFNGIVDLKIQNRREETNLETPNYFLFV